MKRISEAADREDKRPKTFDEEKFCRELMSGDRIFEYCKPCNENHLCRSGFEATDLDDNLGEFDTDREKKLYLLAGYAQCYMFMLANSKLRGLFIYDLEWKCNLAGPTLEQLLKFVRKLAKSTSPTKISMIAPHLYWGCLLSVLHESTLKQFKILVVNYAKYGFTFARATEKWLYEMVNSKIVNGVVQVLAESRRFPEYFCSPASIHGSYLVSQIRFVVYAGGVFNWFKQEPTRYLEQESLQTFSKQLSSFDLQYTEEVNRNFERVIKPAQARLRAYLDKVCRRYELREEELVFNCDGVEIKDSESLVFACARRDVGTNRRICNELFLPICEFEKVVDVRSGKIGDEDNYRTGRDKVLELVKRMRLYLFFRNAQEYIAVLPWRNRKQWYYFTHRNISKPNVFHHLEKDLLDMQIAVCRISSNFSAHDGEFIKETLAGLGHPCRISMSRSFSPILDNLRSTTAFLAARSREEQLYLCIYRYLSRLVKHQGMVGPHHCNKRRLVLETLRQVCSVTGGVHIQTDRFECVEGFLLRNQNESIFAAVYPDLHRCSSIFTFHQEDPVMMKRIIDCLGVPVAGFRRSLTSDSPVAYGSSDASEPMSIHSPFYNFMLVNMQDVHEWLLEASNNGRTAINWKELFGFSGSVTHYSRDGGYEFLKSSLFFLFALFGEDFLSERLLRLVENLRETDEELGFSGLSQEEYVRNLNSVYRAVTQTVQSQLGELNNREVLIEELEGGQLTAKEKERLAEVKQGLLNDAHASFECPVCFECEFKKDDLVICCRNAHILDRMCYTRICQTSRMSRCPLCRSSLIK